MSPKKLWTGFIIEIAYNNQMALSSVREVVCLWCSEMKFADAILHILILKQESYLKITTYESSQGRDLWLGMQH